MHAVHKVVQAARLGCQLRQCLVRRGRAKLPLGIASVLPLADPTTQGRLPQLTPQQCLSQPSDSLQPENTEPYPHYPRSTQNSAPLASVSGRQVRPLVKAHLANQFRNQSSMALKLADNC